MTAASRDSVTRLYAEASRGDQYSVEELLQQYLPRLRAFVRARLQPELRARESASDVVQSVCREFLQHEESFRYEGESEFRGWLFTAAANKVREKIRLHHQPKRDVVREESARTDRLEIRTDSAAGPSQLAIANERALMLEAALDTLGDSDREVITLSRLAELPIEVVAARLGKSATAARKQLGRALLRLGEELNRRGGASE